MSLLLLQRFCDMKYIPPIGSTRAKLSPKYHRHQILPATSGVYERMKDSYTQQVLAYFFRAYGHVEKVTLIRGSPSAVIGDYSFLICFWREGYVAILDTITYAGLQMMIVVEGRRLHYWFCKQRHLAKTCPQKNGEPSKSTALPTKPVEKEQSKVPHSEGEWTEVVHRKSRTSAKTT